MVSGKHKSRSLRKIFVKTPGSRTVQYRAKTPSIARCGECKAKLNGIPRKVSTKFKNITKSQKTVARPYGGNLCSKCTRIRIINQTRKV